MNLKRKHFVTAASASLAWLLTTHAYGHFVVLKPASWLKEDALGGPQKGSPCGPGNTRPFIGDDVQPIPASGAVTTFHAGETITVQWQETVYHPGYFQTRRSRIQTTATTILQRCRLSRTTMCWQTACTWSTRRAAPTEV
jgi:hypothetical protein